MVSRESQAIANRARRLYEQQLRAQLESRYRDKFVCIEPASGRYFLGDTLDEAVNAALDALPDCITHTLRIGHAAPLQLGGLTR